MTDDEIRTIVTDIVRSLMDQSPLDPDLGRLLYDYLCLLFELNHAPAPPAGGGTTGHG